MEGYTSLPIDDPATVVERDQLQAAALDQVRESDGFIVVSFKLHEDGFTCSTRSAVPGNLHELHDMLGAAVADITEIFRAACAEAGVS